MEEIDEIIQASNHDVRQTIYNLQLLSRGGGKHIEKKDVAMVSLTDAFFVVFVNGSCGSTFFLRCLLFLMLGYGFFRILSKLLEYCWTVVQGSLRSRGCFLSIIRLCHFSCRKTILVWCRVKWGLWFGHLFYVVSVYDWFGFVFLVVYWVVLCHIGPAEGNFCYWRFFLRSFGYSKLEQYFEEICNSQTFQNVSFCGVDFTFLLLLISQFFSKKERLAALQRAADSISNGDLIDRVIRSSGAWSLLNEQVIFVFIFVFYALLIILLRPVLPLFCCLWVSVYAS